MADQLHRYERRIYDVLRTRMDDEPAVVIQGPRTVGKSTLLQALGEATDVPVIDLDDPATRDAVTLEPRLFVSGPRPVLIDEYQKLPIILDAIKAELNQNSAPGQFVLTGSTRFEALPTLGQALTGRLHRLPLRPLTQAELEGVDTNAVKALFANPASFVSTRPSTTPRAEYVHRMVRGGFPAALARAKESARSRWFDDYVALTLERDAADVRELRRANLLPQLLKRLAGQTAQVLNVSKAGAAVGLDANTAGDYVKVLEALFLLARLPAWGKTLTTRSTRSPKVHMVDSGVAARLLLMSETKLAQPDATALTQLGHLLETFVVGELSSHASWLDENVTLGHWRTHDGDEVDLVLENDDGRVVGVEVKASTRVTTDDFGSLRKLRNALPGRFHLGVVFHLGERLIRTDDGLVAAPVDMLWR